MPSTDKRQVELPALKPLHLDLAYATTVHSSQGTTAERVLIDAATWSKTTARDVYYVALSRAQQEARIDTSDRSALPEAIERDNVKHAAARRRRTQVAPGPPCAPNQEERASLAPRSPRIEGLQSACPCAP